MTNYHPPADTTVRSATAGVAGAQCVAADRVVHAGAVVEVQRGEVRPLRADGGASPAAAEVHVLVEVHSVVAVVVVERGRAVIPGAGLALRLRVLAPPAVGA